MYIFRGLRPQTPRIYAPRCKFIYVNTHEFYDMCISVLQFSHFAALRKISLAVAQHCCKGEIFLDVFEKKMFSLARSAAAVTAGVALP